MFNGNALLFSKPVDTAEPFRHSGVQLQVFAQGHKVAATNRFPVNMGFVQHQVHVGQDAVHFMFFRQVGRFCPKLIGRHAQVGNEGVRLHIRGAKGFVKIIHQRDDGFFRSHFLSPFCNALIYFIIY